LWRIENILPLPGFHPQTVQLVGSLYTDYAILAHSMHGKEGKMRNAYRISASKHEGGGGVEKGRNHIFCDIFENGRKIRKEILEK
jgi:hypothetical protein